MVIYNNYGTVRGSTELGARRVCSQHLIQKKYVFFFEEEKDNERVPESVWKPHKSKEDNFLNRNYIPPKILTPKKNIFFRARKNIYFFRARKKNPENFVKKNENFNENHMTFH